MFLVFERLILPIDRVQGIYHNKQFKISYYIKWPMHLDKHTNSHTKLITINYRHTVKKILITDKKIGYILIS